MKNVVVTNCRFHIDIQYLLICILYLYVDILRHETERNKSGCDWSNEKLSCCVKANKQKKWVSNF